MNPTNERIHGLESQAYYANKKADCCAEIIESIESGAYYNASIQIRFNLNHSKYNWYKGIQYIIDDQIGNLFYDIETGSELTLDFFKSQERQARDTARRLYEEAAKLRGAQHE